MTTPHHLKECYQYSFEKLIKNKKQSIYYKTLIKQPPTPPINSDQQP